MLDFLNREHIIAKPGFSRWLVPPAALAIHLSIGQVYAFSVFKIPLLKLIGVTQYSGPPTSLINIPSAPGDWSDTSVAWIFSIAILFLGLSAALFGTWLERVGPRKAMLASACCFAGGFFISAFGVSLHQLWIIYLGYGVLGGIGLGLGYISPVSTLIKWFPDRPGMATGMAIMGFGGGAMIGAPLANLLMAHFKTVSPSGVVPAMLIMGAAYFIFILFGASIVRVPAPGWKPAGYVPSTHHRSLITTGNVRASQAIRTPQFYLLWCVLFLNVTAGIGILEQASPMIQRLFSPRISAIAAGGFVGLLSIFNMAGRFGWASCSDYIGRKGTYIVFFLLGSLLFFLIPVSARIGSVPMFVCLCCVIISMYGGGFATIPAYLRDLFGTVEVGAIHGRLLTAWSAAGIAGPLLVSYMYEHQKAAGVADAERYDLSMYVMACLLLVGFVCDILVRRVSEDRFVKESSSAPAVTTANGGTANRLRSDVQLSDKEHA
jgi:MFS family permease